MIRYASMLRWLVLLAVAAIARAEVTIAVPTEIGSGVTIKLSSPVASTPRFGFMPVRVAVENLTTSEGVWRFRFDAGNARLFPGLASSSFELAVPAARHPEAWFYVPVAEPGISFNPGLLVSAGAGPTLSLPNTPPPIAGVFPNPKIPGVSYDLQTTTSSSAQNIVRTFTVTQIGPGAVLPDIPQGRLPPGATSSSTRRASDGLVTRVVTIPMPLNRTGQPAPATTTTPAPTVIAITNARKELAAAGLAPANVRTTTSTEVRVLSSGTHRVRVTIRQTGRATDLPLPSTAALPAGFTSVDVMPEGTDGTTVTREFVYVELVSSPPPAATPAVPLAIPRPKSSSELQAEARRALASTRLLTPGSPVKTSTHFQPVNLQSWPAPPPGGIGNHLIVLFEQTGPSSALPQPAASTLPPGVRSLVHPTAKANEVTRIVTYVDPSVPAALMASASSLPGATQASAMTIARLELQRLGLLWPRPGLNQPAPVTRHSSPGATGPHDLIIFSETGPAALLPVPPRSTLPAGTTATVTPAPISGEVTRSFVVNIPAILGSASVAVPLPVRGTTPSRVSTGTMLTPSTLSVEVSGPGVVRSASRTTFPNTIANTAMVPLAATPALEQTLRGLLATAGTRAVPNIAPLNPAQLPADWRMWSSFNSVLLKTEEFAALDPARRAALRSWVATGGWVFLSPENPGTGGAERVGAGRIETLAEPLGTMSALEIFSQLQLDTTSPAMPERERMTLVAGTPMGDVVNFELTDTLWISLLLVLFALLIGPANVFFLAPAKRRYRLFITTPLLSLCGAIAIGIAIVLQDGLGGEGLRRTVVLFVPGENQAAVFQEQAARTGFLMRRNFALGDGVICSVLPVDGNVFTASFSDATFVRTTAGASGDWFRNRSRQAHLLRTLIPTRARIEVVGESTDGSPQVESTLATEIRDFRLRDDRGRIWSAERLPTGSRVTLRSESRFAAAATASLEAGGNGTPHLNALSKEASTLTEAWQWVARGDTSDIAPIVTLRSIRWTDDPILYAGIARRSSATEKTAAR